MFIKKQVEIKDGKTRCEICDRWFEKLSTHINTHGLSADDYRGKFGFGLGTNINAKSAKGNYKPTEYNTRKIEAIRARIDNEIDGEVTL